MSILGDKENFYAREMLSLGTFFLFFFSYNHENKSKIKCKYEIFQPKDLTLTCYDDVWNVIYVILLRES